MRGKAVRGMEMMSQAMRNKLVKKRAARETRQKIVRMMKEGQIFMKEMMIAMIMVVMMEVMMAVKQVA